MDVAHLEGLASAVYEEADLESDQPESPVALARAVLGPDAVQIVPPAALRFTKAQLSRFEGDWRIYVRRLPRVDLMFAVAHELAHFVLRRDGYDEPDEEAAADYLGACLIAPHRAFRLALRDFGRDLPLLAECFGATETLVALRFGESTQTPIALVRPGRVRVRSQLEFVWPEEATIKKWASGVVPKGIVKTKLQDDPRRTLLVGDDLEDCG